MYINNTLKEYGEALSSKNPTPGGGSAISYTGVLGISLVEMAMAFSIDKDFYKDLNADVKTEIENNLNRLADIKIKLEEYVDKDAYAFDEALKAFKLPKTTAEEKLTRAQAIEDGYKTALEAPLDVFESAYEAINLIYILAENSNKNLISDMGLGSKLLYTTLEGSVINIYINLSSIKDEDYKAKILKTVDEKLKGALSENIKIQEFIDKIIRGRIG